MARKRLISPDYFTHDGLSGLRLSAHFLFAGLWCYCDDEGRGKDNPKLIKAQVAPLRDDLSERRIADDLTLLATAGMICRYPDDGGRYLHVPTWATHQKPSHATASKLPSCPFHDRMLLEGFESDSGVIRERLRPNVVQVREGQVSEGWPSLSGPALAQAALREAQR